MSRDEPIEAYVRSVRSSLDLPKKQRLRILEEIENHLNDGAAAHMGLGTTREHAWRWAAWFCTGCAVAVALAT